MAERHVITALTAKRKQIERLVRLLTKKLQVANAELEAIEAAFRIFKADIALSAPPTSRPAFGISKGDSLRAVFRVLRAAPKPLNTWHLTELLMRERGLPPDDTKLYRTMEQRLRASLNYYRRTKGVLK
ncbi:MAG: hypothetical protein WDN01_05635 [Rhizomicrobium sp.]